MNDKTAKQNKNDWWQSVDDKKAMEYDARAKKALPGYALLHDLTCVQAKRFFADDSHILLAGCGTGLELLRLSGVNKTWNLTGAELSSAMAEICKKRIKNNKLQQKAQVQEGDVCQMEGEVCFDGATSLLVSHFVKTKADKLAYFQAISRRMKPGAKLLVADIVAENTSAESFTLSGQAQSWAELQIANGIARDMVEKGMRYAENNIYPLNIEDYIDILKQANFMFEENYFKALFFSGFVFSRK